MLKPTTNQQNVFFLAPFCEKAKNERKFTYQNWRESRWSTLRAQLDIQGGWRREGPTMDWEEGQYVLPFVWSCLGWGLCGCWATCLPSPLPAIHTQKVWVGVFFLLVYKVDNPLYNLLWCLCCFGSAVPDVPQLRAVHPLPLGLRCPGHPGLGGPQQGESYKKDLYMEEKATVVTTVWGT